MWHTEPKNDAWREVHLAHVESLGNRLWLRCNSCGHSLTPDPREFASEHHLDMRTPLLAIARRLKCTHCNARKAHAGRSRMGLSQKVLSARSLSLVGEVLVDTAGARAST